VRANCFDRKLTAPFVVNRAFTHFGQSTGAYHPQCEEGVPQAPFSARHAPPSPVFERSGAGKIGFAA
jgi:hypothetical protein